MGAPSRRRGVHNNVHIVVSKCLVAFFVNSKEVKIFYCPIVEKWIFLNLWLFNVMECYTLVQK